MIITASVLQFNHKVQNFRINDSPSTRHRRQYICIQQIFKWQHDSKDGCRCGDHSPVSRCFATNSLVANEAWTAGVVSFCLGCDALTAPVSTWPAMGLVVVNAAKEGLAFEGCLPTRPKEELLVLSSE